MGPASVDRTPAQQAFASHFDLCLACGRGSRRGEGGCSEGRLLLAVNREAEQQATHNRFLDALRAGGTINMYSAAPVLADSFGLSKAEARRALAAWMQTFSARSAAGEVAQ